MRFPVHNATYILIYELLKGYVELFGLDRTIWDILTVSQIIPKSKVGKSYVAIIKK